MRLFSAPRLLLATLCLTLGTAACVTKDEGELMRKDIRTLQEELATANDANKGKQTELDARLREAEEKTRDLQRAAKDAEETGARGRADLGTEVQTLQQDFAQLRGQLETREYQLRERELQLGASQDQVKKLEDRIAALELQLKDLQAKAATAAAAPPPAPPAPKEPPKPEWPTDKQALYDASKKAFDDGDFAKCREGFEKFTKAFPKDKELLDNAYFWIGECHFKENKFDKAILSYQKVITDFAQSEKADACLFKMGVAFTQLGFEDEARVFFEDLLSKYPKSVLAKEARQRLDELLKKKKAAAKSAPAPQKKKK